MTYLRYFYMGLHIDANYFHVDYACDTFSSANNLVNTAASTRTSQQTKLNLDDEDYSATFATNEIVMLIYIGGYKTRIGTTGIYVKLDVEVIDGVRHRIKYETSGDAVISEITYYRISFDKTALV